MLMTPIIRSFTNLLETVFMLGSEFLRKVFVYLIEISHCLFSCLVPKDDLGYFGNLLR